jgi:preprotein translocase subunit Sec61beta
MQMIPEHRHESTDVRIRPLAIFVFALFLAVVVVLAAMAGLYRYFAAHQPKPEVPPSPLVRAPQTPPAIQLQAVPAAEMRALRAHEERVLTSYGWVDRSTGVVRIPIDRAIELMAQRGEPKK